MSHQLLNDDEADALFAFQAERILNDLTLRRPRTYSVLTLDFELRKRVEQALEAVGVGVEYNGTRLTLDWSEYGDD